ncbi:tyrosine-type recombinase/integrase [Methylobacterium sp. J-026]|uniref:tyrosine-type recombinase/integrase n=1 Tax=Methylobacterium sp. J-026 TaxID=2836624 RepID=UPI001FBA27CB|nr:tyrosine-type recombinase/integrase [Methylobacterium sp. J-026]MCJ2135608.1 tyrosine-type recombinase/integrase [Methylobacterium sp. J-026]
MPNDLICIENSASEEAPAVTPPAVVSSIADQARDYAALARSGATRKAYAGDVRAFTAWCEAQDLCALPAHPGTMLAYLIENARTLKVATLRRRLIAVRQAHAVARFELDTSAPAFRDAWAGLQRKHGQPPNKKKALLTAELRRAVEALPETLSGRRDRALILVGFAAALRRSELAGLEVVRRDGASWVEDGPDGLVIHLGRTKTDQSAAGAEVGVPYGSDPSTCPVRNFRAWIKAAKIKVGPAFRSINRHGQIGKVPLTGAAVAEIVKRAIVALALREGATPRQAEERAAAFAGHSLRSGLATSAAANDAPGHAIQRQLRHKRYDTTLGYIRSGALFKQNAAGMAGL